MITYNVSLRRDAANYLERCDTPTRERLIQKLNQLKADPFDPASSKPLKGQKDRRSARVGGLRILFRVDDTQIMVSAIGPRGEIYKHNQ